MRRELKANQMLLFIGTDGITYPVVVCLTDNGVTRGSSTITTSSKCGPSTSAGAQTNSVTFAGNVLLDPDANETSVVDLINYYNDQTTIYFKMGELEPAEGSYTHFGSGFISDLNESYAVDAAATFTGTIAPDGLITTTVATS